ncbi:cytochrome c [Paraburkholderia sp. HC6.4b]|uniref:c-type cytochrome n=1 Tax=unclassified Paraburkholderia TaxID=2615204 RepID=UPI00160E3FB1|nr:MULTISPECIES: c-type cytochrome [unclassified Paraburkholderia]MBB5408877.1 cytochrome c [Paraburkholderia sp. HC6.4b]MBB5450605.1 cytochrome c [Paraburkholderia sp. Kb1A]
MRGMTRAGVVFALVVGALAGTMTSVVRAGEAPRGQQVAAANACMGCHAVDRKLVGPSFQQIAAKYKGDAQAPAKLARKVKDGGSGVWGMIPMPAHQSMSDADIRAVVDWVLAGAPSR